MKRQKLTPTTAARRHRTINLLKGQLSSNRPSKKLRRINKKFSGRNNSGKITVRHRGGRQKRFLRLIDFKRQIFDIPANVIRLEYDPNRSANIALLHYQNGVKSYILAPQGLKVGQTVIASRTATDPAIGNCLPLKEIPVGTPIHNVELTPGKGGQIIRSAGSSAQIQDKEGDSISIKLPSGEIRRLPASCLATIGQVGNPDHKNRHLGSAGRRRRLGWRPAVRGTAQHPDSHPHGGGEGRSGIGMPSPKSPWGKPTLGKRTRSRKKYSNKFIIKDRRKK